MWWEGGQVGAVRRAEALAGRWENGQVDRVKEEIKGGEMGDDGGRVRQPGQRGRWSEAGGGKGVGEGSGKHCRFELPASWWGALKAGGELVCAPFHCVARLPLPKDDLYIWWCHLFENK